MENLLYYLRKIVKLNAMSAIIAGLTLIISLYATTHLFSYNKEEARLKDLISDTRTSILDDRMTNHVDTIIHPEYSRFIHYEDSLLLFCDLIEVIIKQSDISKDNYIAAMSCFDFHSKINKLMLCLNNIIYINVNDTSDYFKDNYPLEKFIYLNNSIEEYQKEQELMYNKIDRISINNTLDEKDQKEEAANLVYEMFHSKSFYNLTITYVELYSSINEINRIYINKIRGI